MARGNICLHCQSTYQNIIKTVESILVYILILAYKLFAVRMYLYFASTFGFNVSSLLSDSMFTV